MSNIINKLKQNPKWFYAFSICATWAGAGSLIVGTNMVKQYGIIPFLLWALGNSICCVVFGICTDKFPFLKEIFSSKILKFVIGAMSIFQLWVNMTAIFEALNFINPVVSIILVYLIAIAFLIYYLKDGMIKNVLTDDGGWVLVYGIIFGLVIVSMLRNGVTAPSLGLTEEGITLGIKRFFTLLIGPFFYPYFWDLLKFNNKNDENVKSTNIKSSFALGGMLFGIYICFVFLLGTTTLGPVAEMVKGVLLTLIALSSLTSFIYSLISLFGKKIGATLNILGFIGWKVLLPLGVMGIWNAMQDLRFTILVVSIIVYFIVKKIKNVKEKSNEHNN